MQTLPKRDKIWINTWLFTGVIMVFVQIVLGGITRLTGSGLSITQWEIVTGTIPPLNAIQWEEAFSQYKDTPQYEIINSGISLEYFKMIYFWEYIHRLWARTMGLVFIIPFLFFLWRRSLHPALLKRLAWVIVLAMAAALFGWIMVASGLINRPWVNAYKLTIHLALGISLFIFLFYTWLMEKGFTTIKLTRKESNFLFMLMVLSGIQVCFGGFVSGMKSALLYPTWPLMNHSWIPGIVLDGSHWNKENFLLYDHSGFMPTLVQVIHRNLAYILLLLFFYFAYLWIRRKDKSIHWIAYGLVGIIVVQGLLGILTVLGSRGAIPVIYGALHQGVGVLFITSLAYVHIRVKFSYI